MNKLNKVGDKWEVTMSDGRGTIEAKAWTEKKTVNGKEFVKDWAVLPKGNPTGRTFIPAVHGTEFTDKTSGPRVLGSKLTEEATAKIAELQAQITAIKNDPANHTVPVKVDPNSEEGILAAMDRYFKKLSPEKQAELAASLKKKAGK